MIKVIGKLPEQLASAIEKKLLGAQCNWQYAPSTTSYVHEPTHNNPTIKDTQKFTDDFYIYDQDYKRLGPYREAIKNPQHRIPKFFNEINELVTLVKKRYLEEEHGEFDVFRLMANMQTIRPQWSINAPHPDHKNKDFWTLLYYVNNSDGDTFFFRGSEVILQTKPIKGTAVLYHSTTIHAGSTPIHHQTRVVINCVMMPVNNS